MLREARRDDLPAVLSLMRQLNPDDPELAPDVAESVFHAITGTPGLHLLALEEDGEIVATTSLAIIPNLTRAGRSNAIIENVVVERSRRGAGLGKLLMAGALELAWEAGCHKAMLGTGSRTPATHAFYRACGFDGDEKTAYVAHPRVSSRGAIALRAIGTSSAGLG